MSGLGRLIAEQQLRSDAAMRAAQEAWDNMAPPEPDDDDLLTEADALEQARDETLSASAWVADALAKLTDTPEGWEPVDVYALVSDEDNPLDCVTVETLAVHQLLAIVMVGADKPAMTALRELRERLARELRDDIRGRADELLDEQAAREAEIDHYQEAA